MSIEKHHQKSFAIEKDRENVCSWTSYSWTSWTDLQLASEQIDNVIFPDEGVTSLADAKIVSFPGVYVKDDDISEENRIIDLIGTSKNDSLIDKFARNDASVTIGKNNDKNEMNPPFSHNVTVDTTYKHQSTSSSAITGIELSLALEGLRGINNVLERSLPVTLLQDQE